MTRLIFFRKIKIVTKHLCDLEMANAIEQLTQRNQINDQNTTKAM